MIRDIPEETVQALVESRFLVILLLIYQCDKAGTHDPA